MRERQGESGIKEEMTLEGTEDWQRVYGDLGEDIVLKTIEG